MLSTRRCVTRSALFDRERGVRTKQAARENFDTIEFWFRWKYNLTRTDPRFLEATLDDMLEDFWLRTFKEDPKAADEDEDPDFDPDNVAAELNRLQQMPNDFEDLN